MGYRTGTLSRPTFEDAPEAWADWLPQRTRWFKGWLQTWLVHMREPAQLARELDPRSLLTVQVLLLGMVASALVHPLLVATFFAFAWMLIEGEGLDTARSALLLLDVANIAAGYVSFLALGWRSMARRERKGFWKIVALTPLYWMLLSVAAWNALWQLWRRPHHWNKTAHKPARSLSLLDEAAGS